MELNQIDALIKIITKKMKADERMTKSSKNNRYTSRIFYSGKVSAFTIVLKLLEEIKSQSAQDEWNAEVCL